MTSLETLIIYAGAMKYLVGRDATETGVITTRSMTQSLSSAIPELERFYSIRATLPGEMRDTLFELLQFYIMMDRQKLLGVVPVLRSYKRLPPLFYHLSGIESLYYTVDDRLVTMKPIQSRRKIVDEQIRRIRESASNERRELELYMQPGRNQEEIKRMEDKKKAEITEKEELAIAEIVDNESKLINDTAREIQRLEESTNLTSEERIKLARMKRENSIRIEECNAVLYSPGCSNEIEYRELLDLSIDQRQELLTSDARESITFCHEKFVGIYIRGHTLQELRTKSTPIPPGFAPIYNFGMAMETTFSLVKNQLIISTKGVQNRPFEKLLKKYSENNKTLHMLLSNPDKNANAIKTALEDLESMTTQFAEQLTNCSDNIKLLAKHEKRRIWTPAD